MAVKIDYTFSNVGTDAARKGKRRYGALAPKTRELLERAAEAANRTLPADRRIGEIRVYSGGQPASAVGFGIPKGSTRHNLGGAADVHVYDTQGNRVTYANQAGKDIFNALAGGAAMSGATGIGFGTGYMGNATMHIGYGDQATWGGMPAAMRQAVAAGWANRAPDALSWSPQDEATEQIGRLGYVDAQGRPDVVAFQRAVGITADGIVGPNTQTYAYFAEKDVAGKPTVSLARLINTGPQTALASSVAPPAPGVARFNAITSRPAPLPDYKEALAARNARLTAAAPVPADTANMVGSRTATPTGAWAPARRDALVRSVSPVSAATNANVVPSRTVSPVAPRRNLAMTAPQPSAVRARATGSPMTPTGNVRAQGYGSATRADASNSALKAATERAATARAAGGAPPSSAPYTRSTLVSRPAGGATGRGPGSVAPTSPPVRTAPVTAASRPPPAPKPAYTATQVAKPQAGTLQGYAATNPPTAAKPLAPGVARFNALAATAPKVPYRGPPPALPTAPAAAASAVPAPPPPVPRMAPVLAPLPAPLPPVTGYPVPASGYKVIAATPTGMMGSTVRSTTKSIKNKDHGVFDREGGARSRSTTRVTGVRKNTMSGRSTSLSRAGSDR